LTFESFADGLGLPPTARHALGLAPGAPASPARAACRGWSPVAPRSAATLPASSAMSKTRRTARPLA